VTKGSDAHFFCSNQDFNDKADLYQNNRFDIRGKLLFSARLMIGTIRMGGLMMIDRFLGFT
jgi:hypothetical protein